MASCLLNILTFARFYKSCVRAKIHIFVKEKKTHDACSQILDKYKHSIHE